jgi:hypothetical protein
MDGNDSPPKKKSDRRSRGLSDFPSTQGTPIASADSAETAKTSTEHTPLPDASSSNTTAKMFCCGKHLNSSSDSKRDVNLFHKASAALIELLLKIRTMDTDPCMNSSSGISDFTVLDQLEFKDSPLKSFFEHNFSPEEKDLVDHLSFLAIQKSIEDDISTTMQRKFQGALNSPVSSSCCSITDKLQAQLDIEVTKAREREDATRFAMETCRRKLERLIDDSSDQQWVSTLASTLSDNANNSTLVLS